MTYLHSLLLSSASVRVGMGSSEMGRAGWSE